MLNANKVGFKDQHKSGWINNETGELLTGVHVHPGMKVVDIGCGDGGYVSFCSRMGADVTFVDTQEAKVRALEDSLKGIAQGAIEGIVSDCNPIPLEDGNADLVISTEVLEHVADPEAFLKEIVRIGSSDALYLLTVPDARGEELIKTVANPAYFQEPNHIHIFSAESFEDLVKRCGLEVVRHEYQAGFWAIFYLFKWATSEPGEGLNSNVHPSTIHWTRAWNEVLEHPNGEKIREALNRALPRCQVIVARRKRAV